jgi:hypothetical protein
MMGAAGSSRFHQSLDLPKQEKATTLHHQHVSCHTTTNEIIIHWKPSTFMMLVLQRLEHSVILEYLNALANEPLITPATRITTNDCDAIFDHLKYIDFPGTTPSSNIVTQRLPISLVVEPSLEIRTIEASSNRGIHRQER